MDRRRTVEPRGLQLQRLEDIEQLQQGRAAAAGWGHGQHRMALELAAQRTHPRGLVALKILPADQTVLVLHQADQGLGQGAAVEAAGTLLGDAAQAGRQQWLLQQLTGTVGRTTSLEELGGAAGVGLEDWCRRLQGSAQLRPHRKAVLRQTDRRLHHRRQRQTAVTLLHLGQARNGPRHSRAQQAAQGQAPVDRAIGVQKQIRSGLQRGLLAEVQGHGLTAAQLDGLGKLGPPGSGGAGRYGSPLRQPEHEKTTTTQIPRLGQGHRQGEGGGHGRIDGITALPQDLGTDRRGLGLLGRHDSRGRLHRVEALTALLQQVREDGMGERHGNRGEAKRKV